MGLAAFVVFVVPWMAFAVWLAVKPGSVRLGAPAAPWRPLTDYPPPARDQRQAGETQSMASAGAHDGKHQPIASI